MILDTIPINIVHIDSDKTIEFFKLLLPIIGIFIGAILGFGIQKINEYLNFRKTRKYFFYSLHALKGALDNQIHLYEEFIKSILQKNNNKPYFRLDVGFNLKSINIVSNDNIYKILSARRLKKNNKRFTDIKNLLDGFVLVQICNDNYSKDSFYTYKSINDKLDSFIGQTKFVRDEIFDIIKLSRTTSDEKIKEFKNELDIVDAKFKILIKQGKVEGNNIFDYYKYLIIPLKPISETYDQINLIKYCLNIEQTYTELIGSKNSFAEQYSHEKQSLIRLRDNISSLLLKYTRYMEKEIRK